MSSGSIIIIITTLFTCQSDLAPCKNRVLIGDTQLYTKYNFLKKCTVSFLSAWFLFNLLVFFFVYVVPFFVFSVSLVGHRTSLINVETDAKKNRRCPFVPFAVDSVLECL